MKGLKFYKNFLSTESFFKRFVKVPQMNFNDKMKDKQQAEEKFYFDKEESNS